MSSPTGPAPELAPVVTDEFIRYFRHLAGRVDRHMHSIPREKLWVKPFPFGNSIGHLVLHLTGNLNHYIGAVIAGTGYVRDRPHEFIDPNKYPAEAVLERFHAAIDLVERTLRSLGAEGFTVPVSENQPIENALRPPPRLPRPPQQPHRPDELPRPGAGAQHAGAAGLVRRFASRLRNNHETAGGHGRGAVC